MIARHSSRTRAAPARSQVIRRGSAAVSLTRLCYTGISVDK